MKNIWIFQHYAVPPQYYPLTRAYDFSRCLINKGYNITIFCASSVHNSKENINLIDDKSKYRVENIDNIRYVYIKASNYKTNGIYRIKNMFDYFFGLNKIYKSVEKIYGKCDIIYASSAHPLTCVAGIRIAKKLNIPCICEVRDLWPLSLIELGRLKQKSILSKMLYKLEHWIYKKADSVIFTMEGGKDYISDMSWSTDKGGCINLNKLYHINNGINLNIFDKQKKECVFIDKDLDNNHIFKVIYTGSIRRANCIENIVETAAIIKEKGYNCIKFIIFGDGILKDELEKFCVENKLDNIIFKGKVEKKYIANILSKSDLSIFTGENSGLYKYGLSLNKMFDYVASGKPILSNIECGYDILEKYNCGITVKSGEIESLVDGVLKFYNMPRIEYNQYCTNALRASQEYDFEKLTDKLEQIIINTLKNKELI